MASANNRSARIHWSLEQAVVGLCLLGGLPAAIALGWIVWGQNYSFEVRWTLAAVMLVVWIGCAAAAYQMVTRVLYLAANLLGALHEGDYSIRGTGAKPGSAADLVMKEINSLGNTLQRQRSEAVESTALLTSVMGAIDVAVFAFDMDEKIVLANPGGGAAAQQARRPRSRATTPARCGCRRISRATRRGWSKAPSAPAARLELRRSTFYRDGKPHQLLVFADLSRALREEQQLAWQRIVRVLSHEINNSLTPIKSIAHSIKRMISRIPDVPRAAEIQDGLNLIETRSGALGRFLRQYAQLAKLPKPQERPIQILPLARRIAELENRLPIEVRAGDGRPGRGRSRSARAAPDQHRPQRRGRDASRPAARCGSTGPASTGSCRSRSRTKGRACPTPPTCSCRSSRPNRRAPASASR